MRSFQATLHFPGQPGGHMQDSSCTQNDMWCDSPMPPHGATPATNTRCCPWKTTWIGSAASVTVPEWVSLIGSCSIFIHEPWIPASLQCDGYKKRGRVSKWMPPWASTQTFPWLSELGVHPGMKPHCLEYSTAIYWKVGKLKRWHLFPFVLSKIAMLYYIILP